MELPLVVGVDGSDSSLAAVDWAVDEAARRGVPLRVVHASLWEHYEGALPSLTSARPQWRIFGEHIVASAAERAQKRRPEVKATAEVLAEDVVPALLREADGAVAVVTGHRGRGHVRGLLLGSVSLEVAARAAAPVIVVRGAELNVRGTNDRVLVGVGSHGGEAPAVEFAAAAAALRRCRLDAVHAWRCPDRGLPDYAHTHAGGAEPHLTAAQRALDDALHVPMRRHPEVQLHRRTSEGAPRDVLLRESAGADLLVVGARRRAGVLSLQLGPVSHAVLHHADCPVAVVPSPG